MSILNNMTVHPVVWPIILVVSVLVFYVNLISYVLDTDSTLNKYYKEQNTCGKEVLEKYTVRFRMPYYHKERSRIFIIINYVCFAIFTVGSLLKLLNRDLIWIVFTFFMLITLGILIVNEAYLKSSIKELTEDDLYNQGNFRKVRERIDKLLNQEFFDEGRKKITCPKNDILCNFPSKLKDKIEKSIRVDNDLISENISNWINTTPPADGNPDNEPNRSKMILSYLCFTPDSSDLNLLFDNTTINEYSERNNINYIQTPNDKINVNERDGILMYFKKLYAPYLTFTIILSTLLLFCVFIVFKRNGSTIHLVAFIITLYIIAYILGFYAV